MANGGRIDYTLGFKVDTSSLGQIDKIFEKLNSISSKDLGPGKSIAEYRQAAQDITKAQIAADKLKTAMYEAFNQVTGTTNIDKFNRSLEKSGTNIRKVYNDMKGFGVAGEQAFRACTTGILKTNTALIQTETLLDRMGSTLARSIKWQVSGMAIQKMMGSVNEAFGYVKKLDTSLNNIQIVTQKSADEMERFATKANRAAQAMGAATTSYTDAALIYYQEGLNTEDAETLGDLTVKIANVTGENAETVSQNVTAVVNGYQIAYQEAEQTMDKLAAVAANSASNLNELSTAMSKTAASANMVGMDVDRLTAALSTTISVTRQAPETVGTAYKTILARLGDLKIDGEDEDGYSLGLVSSQLKDLGVDILDANNNMRDMGDVIDEIGEKWQTWNQGQQQAAAIAMAGKRQYTMLTALFDNWDRYNSMLDVEDNSLGTLQQQQDTYMESTAAHLQSMRTAFENVFDSFLDTDTIEGFADTMQVAANTFASFLDGINGGGSLLLSLGAIATKVFSKQIASGLNTTTNKIIQASERTSELNKQIEFMNGLSKQMTGPNVDKMTSDLTKMQSEMLRMKEFVPEKEWEGVLQILEATTEQMGRVAEVEAAAAKNAEELKMALSDAQGFGLTGIKNDSLKELQKAVMSQGGGSLENFANSTSNISLKKLSEQILETEFQYSELINLLKEPINLNSIKNLESQFTVIQNKKLDINIKPIQKAINTFRNSVQGVKKGSNEYKAAIQTLEQEFEKFSITAGKGANANKKVITAIESGIPSLETEIQKLKQLQAAFDKVSASAKRSQIGSQILKITGGLGSLAMGITQIRNLGSIWENEDIDTGEKILETVTNLGFAIPMMVSGIQSVIELGKILTTLGKAELLQSQARIALAGEETAIQAAQILATEGLTAAKEAEAMARLQELGITDADTASKIINIATTNAETGAVLSLTAALKGLTVAMLTNPITWIAAGVAVLGAGFYSAYKDAHRFRDEYKSIVDTNESISNSFKETNDKINSITSSLSNLESKKSSLKNMAEGTTEWRNALSELNEEFDTTKNQYNDLVSNFNSDDKLTVNNAKDKQILQDANLLNADGTIDGSKLNLELGVDYIIDGQGAREYTDIGVAKMNVVAEQVSLDGQKIQYANNLAEAKAAEKAALEEAGIGPKTTPKTAPIKGMPVPQEVEGDNATARGLYQKIKIVQEDTGDIEKSMLATTSFYQKYGLTNDIQSLLANEFRNQIRSVASDEAGNYETYIGKALESSFNEQTLNKIKSLNLQDANMDNLLKEDYWANNNISDKLDMSYNSFIESLLSSSTTINSLTSSFEAMNNRVIAVKDTLNSLITTDTSTKAYQMMHLTGDYQDADAIISEDQISAASDNLSESLKTVFNQTLDKIEITDEDLQSYASTIPGAEVKNGAVITAEGEKIGEDAIKEWKTINQIQEEYLNNEHYVNEELKAMKQYTADIEDGIKNIGNAFKNVKDKNDKTTFVSKNGGDIAKMLGLGKDTFKKDKNIQDFVDKYWDEFSDAMKSSGDTQIKKMSKLGQKFRREMMSSYFKNGKITLGDGVEVDYEEFDQKMQNGIEELQKKYSEEIDINGEVNLSLDSDDNYFNQGISSILDQVANGKKSIEDAVSTIEGSYQVALDVNSEGWQEFAAARKAFDDAFAGDDPIGMAAAAVRMEAAKSRIQYTLTNESGNNNGLFSNNATSSPGGSPGGKGGSGGGGGKGGKGGKKNPKKKFGEDTNPYYTQEKAIDNLNSSLDKLKDTQDKTFGLDRVKNLDLQNKNIKNQIDLVNKEIAITNKLAAQEEDIGKKWGLTFKDGIITNYDEIVEKERQRYNKSKRGEKQTERWEEFTQFLEDYDSNITQKYQALNDQVAEHINSIVENQISKIDTYVEIHVDYSDMLETWQDFRRDIINDIKDDDYLNLNKFALTSIKETVDNGLVETYRTEMTKAYAAIQQYKDSMDANSQNGISTDYWNDENSAYEDMKEAMEGIMESWTTIKEMVDETGENYVSAIEKASDELEKQVSLYELINDQYEHDMNILSTLYGEDAYAQLQNYYELQVQNNALSVDMAAKTMNMFRQAYDEAVASGNQEAIDAAEEAWENSISNLNDIVEEALETIQNKYANAVNASITAMTDALTAALGTELLDEEMTSIIDNYDVYLDEVNRTFGLQDLASKWQNAIDQSDNVEVQQKLNQLMQDQLSYLEEKGELTEYDLERAEKEYELALKQIALQEAQQNKSKIRLMRDANGNYVYKYTSDQEAIAKAQEELAKAQNDLYNFDEDRFEQNMSDIISGYEEMVEKMTKIAADETLTQEQKYAKQLEIAENYYKRVGKLAREQGFIEGNLGSSAGLAGFQLSEIGKVSSLLNSSAYDFVNAINSNGFTDWFNTVSSDINSAYGTRQNEAQNILNRAGLTLEDIASGNDIVAQLLQSGLKDNDLLVTEQAQMISQTADYYNQALKIWTELQQVINKDSSLLEEMVSAMKRWSGETTAASVYNSSRAGNNGTLETGDTATSSSAVTLYSASSKVGNSAFKTNTLSANNSVQIMQIDGNYALVADATNGKSGWISIDTLLQYFTGFASGGYTGEWANGDTNGRLALLHQKEMVLNQQDTANILSAVDTMRNMVQGMGGNIPYKLYDAMSGNMNQSAQTIEQKVNINASFPDVTSSIEIERALNNLINTASQRVLQK